MNRQRYPVDRMTPAIPRWEVETEARETERPGPGRLPRQSASDRPEPVSAGKGRSVRVSQPLSKGIRAAKKSRLIRTAQAAHFGYRRLSRRDKAVKYHHGQVSSQALSNSIPLRNSRKTRRIRRGRMMMSGTPNFRGLNPRIRARAKAPSAQDSGTRGLRTRQS